MKIKLLPMLSVAAAIFFTNNLSAQRNIDWSVDEIQVPASEIRQIGDKQGSEFKITFVLKNKGTDTARIGDSVFYRIEIPIAQNQKILIPGPNQNTYSIKVLNRDLEPDDTVSISLSANFNLFPSSVSNAVNVNVVSLLFNRGSADPIAQEDNSTLGNNVLTEQLTWYVWQGWGLDVRDINTAESFNVYPNPSTSGVFYINTQYSNTNNNENQIKVYDLNGQLVFSTILEGFTNNQAIDLSELNNGIYFVQYSNGVATESIKISITK